MDKIERDETYESESVTDRSALNMQSKIPFKEIPGARQADQRSHTNVRAGPAAALNASSLVLLLLSAPSGRFTVRGRGSTLIQRASSVHATAQGIL